MHKIKIFFILALSSAALVAQTASKSGLIAEIMEAYGVAASVEATRVDVMKQANEAMKGIMNQLKAARPNLSPRAAERINAAMDKYMNTVMNSWNGAEIVKVYSKIYEDNYSLEELQKLASYVKTESGTKSIKVYQSAQKMINNYIMERMMNSMRTALQVFLQEVRTIVSEEQKYDTGKEAEPSAPKQNP